MLCALALAVSLLFPNVHARTLSGQAIETAQERGAPLVYLVGFTPESGHQAKAWKRRIASGTEGLRAVQMPVLSGFAVLIRPIIEGSMTRKTPPAEHADTQVTTDRALLVEGLQLADPDAGCVVVLVDARGEVRFTARGGPTPAAEAGLRAAWERLEAAN